MMATAMSPATAADGPGPALRPRPAPEAVRWSCPGRWWPRRSTRARRAVPVRRGRRGRDREAGRDPPLDGTRASPAGRAFGADAMSGPGTLLVVGTPIGNLGDVTDRMREVLGVVDVVAAEDTRRTGSLLARLGVAAPRFVSLFEGNERDRTVELVGELRRGRSVALVSDAGMPAVSDPGFRLVRACAEAGIDVRVVPGPSAVLAALVVSGLPTDRFVFEGFLPRRGGERRARLKALAADPRTLVLFESPRRVAGTLEDLAARSEEHTSELQSLAY